MENEMADKELRILSGNNAENAVGFKDDWLIGSRGLNGFLVGKPS